MFDHEKAPREPRPPWAMINPAKPFIQEIRRGVMYTGLEPPTLRAVLETRGCQVLAAFGAMGPRLFWGREDGPWIPYDLDAKDQNADCLVRERPWPWCWGDQLWIAALWDTQPLYLRFTEDFCELYLDRPLGLIRTTTGVIHDVRKEAARVAGGAVGSAGRAAEFLRRPCDLRNRNGADDG